MANTTLFLSSTCFDLSVVRSEIDNFLNTLKIDVLNSEKIEFGVTPGIHSHTACLAQVSNADYLLLIIGGRFGGTYIGSTKSITNEEYNCAVKIGIPRIICVKREILDSIKLWKKNPAMDISSIVDSPKVFDFIDYIRAEATDNWIFPFEKIEDIKSILLNQFAYYLRLFSQNLREKNTSVKSQETAKLDVVDFPTNTQNISADLGSEEQTSLRKGLRALHQILKAILTSEMKADAKKEMLKTLWLIGLHGNFYNDGLTLDNDIFKSYAWSTTRGKRVAKQLSQFAVTVDYFYYEEENSIDIILKFKHGNIDTNIAWALQHFVQILTEKYGDNALNVFFKADMRMFMASI